MITGNIQEEGTELYSRYYQVDILRKSLASIPKEHQLGTHQAILSTIGTVLSDPQVSQWPVLCSTSFHVRAESHLFIASRVQDPGDARAHIDGAVRDLASSREIWKEIEDPFRICQDSLDAMFALLRASPDIQGQFPQAFDEDIGDAIHDAIVAYEEAYPLLAEERQHALDLLHLARIMRASVPLMDSTMDKKILLERAYQISSEASGRFALTGDGDLSWEAGSFVDQVSVDIAGLPEVETSPACPSCNAPVSAGAQFCGACGARLGALPEESGEMPATVSCPKCGNMLKAGARFCGKCGAAISFSPPSRGKTPVTGTCPQCGEPVKPEARFCGKCGTRTA